MRGRGVLRSRCQHEGGKKKAGLIPSPSSQHCAVDPSSALHPVPSFIRSQSSRCAQMNEGANLKFIVAPGGASVMPFYEAVGDPRRLDSSAYMPS